MHGLSKFSHKKDVTIKPEELQIFESDIARRYEDGEIKGPIHLSEGNELELIRILKKFLKMISSFRLGETTIMLFCMVFQ